MIYFSSDHHFSHTNVIRFCGRPFSSVEQMDSQMIMKWNSVVTPKDQVFYLGDFTLGNYKVASQYLEKLNGKLFMMEGNHDRWMRNMSLYPKTKSGVIELLPPLYNMKVNGQVFVLCHYPMSSWLNSHYGSTHLFGHVHGKFGHVAESQDNDLPPNQKRGKKIDVGVDINHFYPVSLDEVLNIIKE